MAHVIWPGENALGKHFRVGDDTSAFRTVVGISENMRANRITSVEEIWYYLPVTQVPHTAPEYFVRVKGRPEDMSLTLRKAMQPLMPGASYVHAQPLRNLITPQQRSWEFGAKMFMGFGGLALILAAIG